MFIIDFLADLSETIKYNGVFSVVLVVVNKLLKINYFISCRSNMTIRERPEMLTKKNFCLNWISSTTIFDSTLFFTYQL